MQSQTLLNLPWKCLLQQTASMRYFEHLGFARLPPTWHKSQSCPTDRQCVCLDRNLPTGRVCCHVLPTHISSVIGVACARGFTALGHLKLPAPARYSTVLWTPGMVLCSRPPASSPTMRQTDWNAANVARATLERR